LATSFDLQSHHQAILNHINIGTLSGSARLTNVIPERIIFVSRGITVVPYETSFLFQIAISSLQQVHLLWSRSKPGLGTSILV